MSVPSTSQVKVPSCPKFLLANIRGFKHKKLELSHILSISPTIAVFTETHLSNTTDSAEMHIQNYTFQHITRDSISSFKERGGGVAVFYPNDYIGTVLKAEVNHSFEIISVLLSNTHCQPLLISGIYRAPRYDPHFTDRLSVYLDSLSDLNHSHILCGDFNLPDINWRLMSGPGVINSSFISLMSNMGLYQLVDEPTRNDNVLDLVFTNRKDILYDLSITCPISDHNKIEASFNILSIANSNHVPKSHRSFRFGDYDNIEQSLLSIDWDYCFSTTSDSNHMYEIFLSIVNPLIVQYIPLHKQRCLRFPTQLLRLKRKCEHM